MARNPGGRSGSWEWSRTAQTRTGMLRAAREVFVEHGFAEASVADVVERAGSSVGSLYHHFGGKTELFLTLWEEHQVAQEQAAASSVAKAKQEGVTSPVELFIAGARAFLEGSWERRDLVRLFMDGDGPPGFELMRRTRGREWVRQNAVLLGMGDQPLDRLTVAVLTTVIGEAGREVATCETEEEAREVMDAAIGIIRRFDPLQGAEER
ncbi:AcrR family transcriptional regulator [Thermocatellispora tengchongensis]|uniref:AcrR family transcriptional regulator n=1 Tax=Thermocatellispora tengchongensis TaxID=1073253 RepID=A0A840PME7_9ACTN|nr:TetR/AcrR family transcriptional regulator [Thermocatellispora tengchongensis]MBB5140119.1 AcrR family transcriptional regulator [Thermocatellispora tengchongensis]